MSQYDVIKERIKIDPQTNCWEWQGKLSRGYGRVGFNGKIYRAHRASYQIFKGVIPNDLHILHKCDNKRCVNPEHLYAGTHQQNMRDRDDRGLQGDLKGVNNGRSKLNESDVIEIRKTPKNIKHVDIAWRFGITPESVSHIRRGITWRHV